MGFRENFKQRFDAVQKILTKNLVKRIIVFISVFMCIGSIVELFTAIYGIFIEANLYAIILIARFLVLGVGAYAGIKTAYLKENPEKDRKYALIFLATILLWVVLFLGQKLLYMFVGRAIYLDMYDSQADIENIFQSFTAFYAFVIILNILIVMCVMTCCLFYVFVSYLNVRYTAQEIDAPYKMVKTEDEDSDVVFELNEAELNENNEEIQFTKNEKPEIDVEEKQK